jgi:hypothetical protein
LGEGGYWRARSQSPERHRIGTCRRGIAAAVVAHDGHARGIKRPGTGGVRAVVDEDAVTRHCGQACPSEAYRDDCASDACHPESLPTLAIAALLAGTRLASCAEDFCNGHPGAKRLVPDGAVIFIHSQFSLSNFRLGICSMPGSPVPLSIARQFDDMSSPVTVSTRSKPCCCSESIPANSKCKSPHLGLRCSVNFRYLFQKVASLEALYWLWVLTISQGLWRLLTTALIC